MGDASALSKHDTIGERQQVRPKGGGTKGGSLSIMAELQITTVR